MHAALAFMLLLMPAVSAQDLRRGFEAFNRKDHDTALARVTAHLRESPRDAAETLQAGQALPGRLLLRHETCANRSWVKLSTQRCWGSSRGWGFPEQTDYFLLAVPVLTLLGTLLGLWYSWRTPYPPPGLGLRRGRRWRPPAGKQPGRA